MTLNIAGGSAQTENWKIASSPWIRLHNDLMLIRLKISEPRLVFSENSRLLKIVLLRMCRKFCGKYAWRWGRLNFLLIFYRIGLQHALWMYVWKKVVERILHKLYCIYVLLDLTPDLRILSHIELKVPLIFFHFLLHFTFALYVSFGLIFGRVYVSGVTFFFAFFLQLSIPVVRDLPLLFV